MSADFFGGREQEKCQKRPFSGENLSIVTPRGRVCARPLLDLLTCGRHGEASPLNGGNLAVRAVCPSTSGILAVNGLAQHLYYWLPIELPRNSGGLLVRCRSMASRA